MKYFGLAVLVFVITGCNGNDILVEMGLKEKRTNVIQVRNSIAYLPNDSTPFTGEFIGVFEDGHKEQRYYKNGKIDGISISWYSTGEKGSEDVYSEGVLNGKSMVFAKNGQIIEQGDYDHGQKHGIWTSWFENGQKQSEIYFHKNQKEGNAVEWFNNGSKRIDAIFHKDILDGKVVAYNSDGSLMFETNFVNGSDPLVNLGGLINMSVSEPQNDLDHLTCGHSAEVAANPYMKHLENKFGLTNVFHRDIYDELGPISGVVFYSRITEDCLISKGYVRK